jgi:hypothetical protein
MPDDAERDRERQELRGLAETVEQLQREAFELAQRCAALLASMGARPKQRPPLRPARTRRPGDTP